MKDPEWFAAFNAQNTALLRKRALRYIASKAWQLEQHGLRADRAYAEDLLDDILLDTCLGKRTWRPSSGSLARHVECSVDSRMSHQCARGERFPVASIDADAATHLELEAALHERSPAGTAVETMTALDVVARLRGSERDDPDLLMVLDAMLAGETDRGSILAATGMGARRYAAARARLDRAVESLPHSVSPFRAR